jgi:hypothetical protein
VGVGGNRGVGKKNEELRERKIFEFKNLFRLPPLLTDISSIISPAVLHQHRRFFDFSYGWFSLLPMVQ